MSDGYLVLCTVPDEEVAERLAKGLVGARLAACVNVVPAIRSFYRWEGFWHIDGQGYRSVCRLENSRLAA